jgi:tetratricopeptide (TPR) repeat protein
MAIFAIAFAVRLVHILQIRRAPFFSVLMGDSRGYDEWAQRIAGGDWLGHDVFYQAPLYPYMLGVIYAVFGRHLLLVRIVQAAIGSASCALVALAVRRLFPARAAIVAGVVMALYAPAIFFDGLLQKSVLDVFFVSLSLWLIARITAFPAEPAEHADKEGVSLRALRVPRATSFPLSPWFWLGLSIGGLSLTRENALVFVIVILTWAWFSTRSAKPVAAFLLGLAIVLAPVAARNSLLGGGFYVTTAQFGPNFYIGNNPKADGTYASLRYGRGAPEYERQDATEIAELALGHPLSPGEVSSYWTDRAVQFITEQPGAWLKLLGRKFALLWNRAEMVDTEDQATYADWSLALRALGPVGHFGVLVPLALLGVIVTWPARSRLWVLYALLAAYAASVVLFYVFARYRFPLVPLLVLFAAAAVDAFANWGRDSFSLKTQTQRTVPKSALSGLEKRVPTPFSGPRKAVGRIAAVAAAAVFANWPILSANLMRAVTENNLAVALQADRRFDEADAHYHRAIAFQSDYAPAYSNLGTLLRARGRLDEAIDAYGQALRLQPSYPDAHYNLANALLDMGRSVEAIDHFQVALKTVPGSAEVHNNLGIALAAKGRHDDAVAEFALAVRLDPGSAKAHRNLGDALLTAGRGAEALTHFERAADLAPEDGALHYDFGSALLEAGRPAEAAAQFRLALKTMPDNPEAHNNLGIALGSQGKMDEAIAEFEKALRARPDFVEARKNLTMAGEGRRRAR